MMVESKNCAIQTGDVDLVANGGDKWSLAASLRYQKKGGQTDGIGTSNQVTLDGRYKLNSKWSVRAYERFDLAPDKKKWYEQQYTIVRDLHCWIAELSFSFGEDHGAGVWLLMKLKAFPDTAIGLKQTYSRPRFGEAGQQSDVGQYRYDTISR
jgi:outer membrane protein assembly factor BamA